MSNKPKLPTPCLLSTLLVGCEMLFPNQPVLGKPDSLWITENGDTTCVNVSSLTFYTERWVKYTTSDGVKKETFAPGKYFSGSECP